MVRLRITRQSAKTSDEFKELFPAESFHSLACESRMPIIDAKRSTYTLHSVQQPSMFSAGGYTFTAHLRAIDIYYVISNSCVLVVKSSQYRLTIMRSDPVRKTRSILGELAAVEAELDRAIRQNLWQMAMKDNLESVIVNSNHFFIVIFFISSFTLLFLCWAV